MPLKRLDDLVVMPAEELRRLVQRRGGDEGSEEDEGAGGVEPDSATELPSEIEAEQEALETGEGHREGLEDEDDPEPTPEQLAAMERWMEKIAEEELRAAAVEKEAASERLLRGRARSGSRMSEGDADEGDPYAGIDFGSRDAEFQAYLREIGRIPLLTVEQEKSLGARINAGRQAGIRYAELARNLFDAQGVPVEQDAAAPDELRRLLAVIAAGEEAQHSMAEANLRLVVSIARRYYGLSSFLDIIQNGNVGLMIAAERFDVSLGNKFSTYATWWIRQKIGEGLRKEKGASAGLPSQIIQSRKQVGRTRKKLLRDLERDPSPEEIAAKMIASGHKDWAYLDLFLATGYVQALLGEPVALDRTVDDEGNTILLDLIAGSPGVEGDAVQRVVLEEAITKLSPRYQMVIRMRFGFQPYEQSYTLEEIGKKHGVTRERIRQIEAKALGILRQVLKTRFR